ncbi:MAG TPA: patatin-like phospholipase family protein [Bryobacteraceae bacterium]|nr:patatin-like phospholipase family protein [Bryobacteraceae bacterium]
MEEQISHERQSAVRIPEESIHPGAPGAGTGRGKTALVLSAGGMFGAYQAGAYKAIAELAPPDIVVGASVGALNGWPIASGCSPDHLIDRWRDPAAGEALKLYPNYGWTFLGRPGWFDPAPLQAQAEGIWRDYQPTIPFGLVMVESPGFHTRLVRHPDVLPAHLRATCSIPLFLPSVQIDGKHYLDGGLFEKIPIWAALEMGATRIIAIDSMPKVGKWWMHLGINIVYSFKPRRRYPVDLDLTLISPSETLGGTDDAVYWKRSNIDRWVDMGMRDATRALSAASSAASETRSVTLRRKAS